MKARVDTKVFGAQSRFIKFTISLSGLAFTAPSFGAIPRTRGNFPQRTGLFPALPILPLLVTVNSK